MLQQQQQMNVELKTFRNEHHQAKFEEWFSGGQEHLLYVHGGEDLEPTIVVTQSHDTKVVQITRIFDIGGRPQLSVDARYKEDGE